MSRIRAKGTEPERVVERILRRLGIGFGRHPKHLAGRPDIVLRKLRIAIFVDGDFWHGWRFPVWAGKLTPFWREKIGKNRDRDRRNRRRLRTAGWTVLRIWEHQIEKSPDSVEERLKAAIARKKVDA